MGKIKLEGYVLVPELELETILEELPRHIQNTESEKGCLVFRVSQDKENKYKLHVYEEFVSEEAFRTHQNNVSESKWGSVSKNCKRHYVITGI